MNQVLKGKENIGKFGPALVLAIAAFLLFTISQGNLNLQGNSENTAPTGLATLPSANAENENTAPQAPQCSDSDNGKSFFTAGYVSGTCADCGSTGIVGSNSDTCTDSESVMEFYCADSGWARITQECPKGCLNGACAQ